MKLRTYSDGGARGNPGPGAIGVLICDEKNQVLREHGHCLGVVTNNEAEYRALISALNLAKEMGAVEVDSFMDSQLVVRQMGGEYRVKAEGMKELFAQAKRMEGYFKRTAYHHLPREDKMMKLADRLVNRALDEEGLF